VRLPSVLRSRTYRLAILYLCLFTASVLVLSGVMYWFATGAVSRQIDNTINAEIRGLAEQYNQLGTAGLIEALEGRSRHAKKTRELYLLTDPNMHPLAGNLDHWPDETPDANGWVTFRLRYPDAEGEGINFGRARVFDLRGGLHLLVGHDIRERVRIATAIEDILAVGLVITIGLSLIGGSLLVRSLLRQFAAINQTSHEIMAGDLGRRIPLSGTDDEFDQLAGNLNAMLDQIERLLAGMKRVTDNIAHDLRTPLGRLRHRLENALTERHGEEACREAIGRAIEEADGLLKTFNALLNIAQAEAGAPRRHFEPVDLGVLFDDVADLYAPVAEDRGLTLRVSREGETSLAGDRALLFQALANLLDNAIKFSAGTDTPETREVVLSLERSDKEVRFVVADHGPGIAADDRERVTEPFYRAEASRSTPGSGLGLSLVAAVARLHGGHLVLADNEPGLRAELCFPLSDGGTGE